MYTFYNMFIFHDNTSMGTRVQNLQIILNCSTIIMKEKEK